METKKTLWKLRHIVKEAGRVTLEELTNCKDEFAGGMSLLSLREYDMNRECKTAEYKYVNDNGVESWSYECDEYTREVGLYPVEIISEEEE